MKNINDFNAEAECYDLFEDKNKHLFNAILLYLAPVFRKGGVKTVIDATCGTGAQAIPLSRLGFRILGSDKAPALLRIARAKARKLPRLRFRKGDVRYSRYGRFDAAISMLNSLGYLSRPDFMKALSNLSSSLRKDGFLVFDNTNRAFLDSHRASTDEYIDTAGEASGIRFVRFAKPQYSKRTGILDTRWKAVIQAGIGRKIVRQGLWRRQTYTAAEVRAMLDAAGFRLVKILDRELKNFDEKNSFAYLVIARKNGPMGRKSA